MCATTMGTHIRLKALVITLVVFLSVCSFRSNPGYASSLVFTMKASSESMRNAGPSGAEDASPKNNHTPSAVSTTATKTVKKNLHGRVLVATWVFGEQANNKKYFQMFVESAKTSGIDIVIIGDHVPKFKLPNNVRHIHIQWKELIDRLFDRGVVPSLPSRSLPIYNTSFYYKVNDYRPLFGYLFPEVLKGYEWWGHCDNDMLLGNVAKRLLFHQLDKYDVISGMNASVWNEELGQIGITWGPFTLYRNQKTTNELFNMMTEGQRIEVFLSTDPYVFDEHGKFRVPEQERDFYNLSMSGIIHNHATELGIRLKQGMGPMYWDGKWWGYNYDDPQDLLVERQQPTSCPPCIYNSSNKYVLETPEKKNGVFACHFQYSKHVIEESLSKQEGIVEKLIEQGEWQADCANGYEVT